MYRGTTPTFVFRMYTQLSLNDMSQIWVTICDLTKKEITFDKTRLVIDDERKELSLTLTQEETLSLSKGPARAQIRMLTAEGKALTTTVRLITIYDVLKDEVIE